MPTKAKHSTKDPLLAKLIADLKHSRMAQPELMVELQDYEWQKRHFGEPVI